MNDETKMEEGFKNEPDIKPKKKKKKLSPEEKARRRAAREKLARDAARYRREVIIYRLILMAVIIVVIIILLVQVFSDRTKGTPLDTSVMVDSKIAFKVDGNIQELTNGFDSMKALVVDNYLKYLNKAYILIGDYPDCEYYKISANVERNNFDWSKDFYVNSGGLYYSYFKDDKDMGRVGIDVSEFQKEINWEEVKSAGVEIAIVRVAYRGYGSGEIKDDAFAATNLAGASEAGLEVGAYFFSAAINKEEGIEEANYLLEKIKGYDIKQPLVIDTEYIPDDPSARTNDISVEDRTDAVVGFCETIEAAGYTPMVYAGRDQFIKYLDVDKIGKWKFWLAAYDTPVFPYHTEGYQYSQYGYVTGIPTQVDLNVFIKENDK